MFRELELYAGNKWFVYTDARIRQFLDEGEMSLIECKSPITLTKPSKSLQSLHSVSTTTPLTTTFKTELATIKQAIVLNKTKCKNDFIDLLFILDTSNSIESSFYAQKNLALDLIKVLPESDFEVLFIIN